VSWIAAEGGEPEELISSVPSEFSTPHPWSLTPDGEALLFVVFRTGGRDIATLGLGDERDFRRVLQNATFPALSPDGAWMAWVEPGGSPRINISTYPDVAQQTYPLAAGNGPVFSRDGRELYFVEGNALRAVSLEYEPDFRIVEAPREVFRASYTFNVWDAHPDGQRLLVLRDAAEGSDVSSPPERQRIHIVLNWTEELQRRLAAE
jgi:hypothetical protein